MTRLLAKCSLVDCIAEETKQEDGDGEAIAAVESVAARKLRESLVVVLCPCDEVPEGRVEDDGSC